jgi:hypothetical protein
LTRKQKGYADWVATPGGNGGRGIPGIALITPGGNGGRGIPGIALITPGGNGGRGIPGIALITPGGNGGSGMPGMVLAIALLAERERTAERITKRNLNTREFIQDSLL